MGALRTSIAGAVVGTVAAAGLYTGVAGMAVSRTSATSADGPSLAASVPHAPRVVVTVKAQRPKPAPTTQDAVEANKDAQAPAPPAPPAPVVRPATHRSPAKAAAPERRAASRERSSGSGSSGSGSSGSGSSGSGSSGHAGSEPQEPEHETPEAPETEDHGSDD